VISLLPMSHYAWMPHGKCLDWSTGVLTLQVGSDVVIAIAYILIPALLRIVVRMKIDIRPLYPIFGAFILGCACTHVMGIVTVWQPVYWIDALVRAGTAVVSIIAAWMLLDRMGRLGESTEGN